MANEWIPLQKQLVPRAKSDTRRLYQIHARRKHKETVQIALKRGFLKSLDKELILDSQLSGEVECRDLQQVVRINVSKCHVQLIDDIAILSCARLRLCNLSSCYVSDITAFYGCMELLVLDVSNNQIGQLPPEGFWGSLASLRVLYLHGNAVSNRDSLASLNGCLQLHILTLHSTPLALINNYRHHVVNSVLTLRALDYHVISDEEIIENLNLTAPFKPLSAPFRLPLSDPAPKGTPFKEELQSVYRLLLLVDRILSRHSPVIIIQRWVRGWLTRRTLKLRRSGTERPPQQQQQQLQASRSKRVISALVPSHSQLTVETHILGLSGSDALRTKYTLNINLNKLQQNVGNAEKQEPGRICKTFTSAFQWRAPKPPPPPRRHSPPPSAAQKSTAKDPLLVSGSPVRVLAASELPDLTTTKKHAGIMIRSAEKEIMKNVVSKRKPELKDGPQAIVNHKDEQMFTRAYATMKTNCLTAVDNAKLRADNAYKAELVARIRQERVERREKAKEFHRKLQSSIKEWRAAEEDRIFALRERLQSEMYSKLSQCSWAHDNEVIASHKQAEQKQFLTQFSHQSTLVSNTLANEDLKASQTSDLAQRAGQVEEARAVSRNNQLMVQRFMKLREAKLTQEGINTQLKLDAAMLQAASERLMDVKKKVAREVARKQAARAAMAETRKELRRVVSRSGPPPPITAELQPLSAHRTPARVRQTSRAAHRTWQRGSLALVGGNPLPAVLAEPYVRCSTASSATTGSLM